MNKIAAVFVTATLLLNTVAPTLAYAATYLEGTKVNANTLKQDAYVAVTYYDSKNKQTLYKGWIDAVDETTFQIRSRALFVKKTIAYNKVLSVIMSERETTRGKQINEVERFIREMKKQEARALETEQTAIQRLNQKTVTVMLRGQIDPSKITKGWYAHIVYTSQGATKKVTSQIADKDSSHIALKDGADTYNIAYNNLDTLIVANHLREIEDYRATGAQYNARVRVHAPSIQKGQMVGRLINMAQDTLVIQKGRSFYQVPVSSISTFDVSTKQYRNTDKGFKIGVGLSLGLVAIGAGITKLMDDSGEILTPEDTALIIIKVVSVPLTSLTTLVGAITKSDKWVEVPPQRLNLSFAPTSTKGLRTALTFKF